MSADSEDPKNSAFERLTEHSIVELRRAVELNDALRAERDDLAAQLAAIRSDRLVRIAMRTSKSLRRLRHGRGRDG